MKRLIIAAIGPLMMLGSVAMIFYLQIPPYQGRALRSQSENFGFLIADWEVTHSDGSKSSGWSSENHPEFKWTLFIECSPEELSAIGLEPKDDGLQIIDSKPFNDLLYLRKDLYLVNKSTLESMRSKKWFSFQVP